MDKLRINQFHITDVKALSVDDTTVTATAAELNGLDVSTIGGGIKIKTLPIAVVATTDEQDTGWDLPAKCVVLDCWVDVTTLETTGGTTTIDVGTLETGAPTGDADGFLDGVSVAAAVIVKGEPTSAGATTNKYWDTCTKGALLCTFNQGASGTGGLYTPNPCTVPGDVSVTYTLGSNDFVELVANIVIMYVEIA